MPLQLLGRFAASPNHPAAFGAVDRGLGLPSHRRRRPHDSVMRAMLKSTNFLRGFVRRCFPSSRLRRAFGHAAVDRSLWPRPPPSGRRRCDRSVREVASIAVAFDRRSRRLRPSADVDRGLRPIAGFCRRRYRPSAAATADRGVAIDRTGVGLVAVGSAARHGR